MKSKERHTKAVKHDLNELRTRLGSEVGISTGSHRTLGGEKVYLQFRVKVTESYWYVLAEQKLQGYEDDGSDRAWATSGLAGLIADAFREVKRLERESKAQGVLEHLKSEL